VSLAALGGGLRVVTAVYLAFPVWLFLIGWLRPLPGLLLAALLAAGVWRFAVDSRRDPDASSGEVGLGGLALVAVALILLTLISGAGGFGHQQPDWWKHNSVLRDLVRQPWPVAYRTSEGPVALVYYVGYYLPAAVVGKLGGWEIANFALYGWTLLGMLLVGLWVVVLTRAHPLLCAVVLVTFSGIDVWSNTLEDGLRNTLEEVRAGSFFRSQRLYLYGSVATSLYFAPQQALAAWLCTSLLLDAVARRDGAFPVLLLGSLSLLWSPFVSIGLAALAWIPIVLAPGPWRGRIRRQLSLPNLAGAAVALLLVAYFVARWGPYALPEVYFTGIRFTRNGLALFSYDVTLGYWLRTWALLCLTDFALLALPLLLAHRAFRRISGPGLLLLAATATLVVLPVFRYGYYNDLVMRASLPALFVLLVFAIELLGRWRLRPLLAGAVAIVLLAGSLNAVSETVRQVQPVVARGALLRMKNPDTLPDFFQRHLILIARKKGFDHVMQYLGSPESLFFAHAGGSRSGRSLRASDAVSDEARRRAGLHDLGDERLVDVRREGETAPTAPRKALFALVLALVLLAFVEAASRVFMAVGPGARFWDPSAVIYSFYPELGSLLRDDIRNDDRRFDVLLLGGSILHKSWGPFKHVLMEELVTASRLPIFVHNLSKPSHTSLDSLHKYRRLARQRFDLVIVYHGINELRFNNTPPEGFRDDYSHVEWYRRVNWIERAAPWLRWTSLPYTLHEAAMLAERAAGVYRPSSRSRPDPEFVRYGSDIKTAGPFRHNLEAILDLADERGEPIVLMSFAWYLPDDYTREGFAKRELDYVLYRSETELWGDPKNVEAGLRAHNEVIADLARTHPGVVYVDERARVPRQGRYWNDVCHLSTRGFLLFVDNLAQELVTRGVLPDARAPVPGG
jgi:hypothetical protein